MTAPVGQAAVPADLPLRADLRGKRPYGAPQVDVPVRLNTNENSFELPEPVALAMVTELAGQVRQLNRYPDREFTALREALAGYLGHGVRPQQVWAANGSNEVLLHLLQAFGGPGRRALGFTPTYSMHQIISETALTGWVHGRRGAPSGAFDLTPDDVAAQVRDQDPDVVFLCSPNNPTGTALTLDVVRAAYQATARAVVVVDEAYAEFARPGTLSALELLAGRSRLVVTRTMSKAFALAGARVGYLAADPAVADALRLVRLPYHLSSLTQAAALAALRLAPDLLGRVQVLREQRDRIVQRLTELGLDPVPSDANFVLFGGVADAPALWAALLEQGVLVRDVGLPGHLRVSAGTPQEVTSFLTALEHVLARRPDLEQL